MPERRAWAVRHEMDDELISALRHIDLADVVSRVSEMALAYDKRGRSSMPVHLDDVTSLLMAARHSVLLVAERDALAEVLQRVRWLAGPPDPDDPTPYMHYAVRIDDRVHLAVDVDDLRTVLDGGHTDEEAGDRG